jgi:hypothetical protein
MTQKTSQPNFAWNIPPQVRTSFLQGEDAETIYNKLGDVPHNLSYDSEKQLITGSSLIGAARIDTIVRDIYEGVRVANPRDLSRPEVIEMVRGKCYTDASALVLISNKDGYERNNSIITQLTDLVEEANGKVEFPLLITGFDIQPFPENEDYGIKIVKRQDFRALHDDRLQGKYHGIKFSEVDENGIPIFDENKNRTFYIKDKGLSRLILCDDLGLDSGWGNLGDSDPYGRVVLVSGEAGAKIFPEEYQNKLRQQYEQRKRELDTWFEDSVKRMPR